MQVARLSPPPPPPSRHKPSSFRAGQRHRGERDRRRVYFFHFLEDGPPRPRRVFADVLSPYLLTFMSVVLRLATTVLASLARLGLCSGDMESLFSALALPKPNPVCRFLISSLPQKQPDHKPTFTISQRTSSQNAV